MKTGRIARSACAVLAIGLSVGGCGIQLRAHHPATVPPALADPYVTPDGTPVPPPASTQPLVLAPRQTVVTITFDDGWASAAMAAQILTTHNLPATFFVNSGTIGKPGHLSLADLKSMAASGNEIAGHTLTHPDLAQLPDDEARRQICDDRTTLLGWGFPIRNFAYPFGSASPEIENMVRQCGYNSARSLDELRLHQPDPRHPEYCDDCAVAETVPPADLMSTKTPPEVNSRWATADLQGQVTDAIAGGGGWVQLTFHKLCTTDCADQAAELSQDTATVATPQAQFEDFVTWLADQQAQGNVIVRTVGDVIGGPVQPPVTGPVAPPAPPGTNGVANPGLQQPGPDGVPACWTHGGFGTNSPEFSLIPGHNGNTAGRLVMRDRIDGDAKLLQTMDLGACAPAVSPGQVYTIAASYTSTVPTSFSVYYRLARGIWVYALSSPLFAPATQFSAARWTLPAIPAGVTAISFGLALSQNGELVTEDYSLTTDGR